MLPQSSLSNCWAIGTHSVWYLLRKHACHLVTETLFLLLHRYTWPSSTEMLGSWYKPVDRFQSNLRVEAIHLFATQSVLHIRKQWVQLICLFPVLVSLKMSIMTGCTQVYNIKPTVGTMKKNGKQSVCCLCHILCGWCQQPDSWSGEHTQK